ncbi:MAG: hypothetical protein O8C66_07165 [Candidatus Methanoperedens sp.]|nr:hypothetical protein [Candidatus Methanoperedens sp.]MCZ7370273.1 hypothetical protein [Candidatus Methanoperedens sp.]
MKTRYRLLLIIFTAAFLLILLFIIQEGRVNQERRISVQPETTNGSAQRKDMQQGGNFTVLVSKGVCEGCHMSGKPSIPQALTVTPHVNGGAYCLICHKISHEVHPINKNVTCEKCHGTSPTKPVYINGNISCNNCHDYPDPLLPSKGNLITIHIPRGVTCSSCHTDECTKCHAEVGTSERWEKRMNHFRTILGRS